MMMIVILDKTLRVLVVRVTFDKTKVEDVLLIVPFLKEEIDKVNHVMPALLHGITARYAYTDAETLKRSFDVAVKHLEDETLPPDFFYSYILRIFRSLGIVENSKDLDSLLAEYKELAEYIKENKNEIY